MRSAAFAPEVARLLGVRVGRMFTVGWALAAAVGALAGVLVAPDTFVSPNACLVASMLRWIDVASFKLALGRTENCSSTAGHAAPISTLDKISSKVIEVTYKQDTDANPLLKAITSNLKNTFEPPYIAQAVITNINSLLASSVDAERRGDMKLADALADRAQVLAKDLINGK